MSNLVLRFYRGEYNFGDPDDGFLHEVSYARFSSREDVFDRVSLPPKPEGMLAEDYVPRTWTSPAKQALYGLKKEQGHADFHIAVFLKKEGGRLIAEVDGRFTAQKFISQAGIEPDTLVHLGIDKKGQLIETVSEDQELKSVDQEAPNP